MQYLLLMRDMAIFLLALTVLALGIVGLTYVWLWEILDKDQQCMEWLQVESVIDVKYDWDGCHVLTRDGIWFDASMPVPKGERIKREC
jgi:hypothetical protein